jgi:hypothetical protein
MIGKTQTGADTVYGAVSRQQFVYHPLLDAEIVGTFDDLSHGARIAGFVGLAASRPNRGSLSGIEASKLNARCVCNTSHLTAQRIDLSNHVAFADTAHCWIAAHGRDTINVHGDQQGLSTQSCRSESRLTAGMAAAYHDYVIWFHRIQSLRMLVSTAPLSQGRTDRFQLLTGFF